MINLNYFPLNIDLNKKYFSHKSINFKLKFRKTKTPTFIKKRKNRRKREIAWKSRKINAIRQ